MSKIIDVFESKANLLVGDGVSEKEIIEAEKVLKLSFSDEYRDYLRKYAVAAYNGHELTGITKSPRVNVVDVTLNERKNNPDIPAELYVIEQTDVEEIVIWQSGNGQVFCSSPNQGLTQLCNSLADYISK